MNIEEYIDQQNLNERLDGDFDLFKELSEIFFDDYKNLLNDIFKAVDNNNAEKIGKTAHTLKGAVSNFSSVKAYKVALKLEQKGKNGETENSQELYKEIEQATLDTIEAIKLIIQKGSFS